MFFGTYQEKTCLIPMKDTDTKPGDPAGEDALLVKAFQRGDRTAFDRLVAKHKDRIFNVCYWFLGDYHEADDIAQETFIKVYRSLDRFRLESAFSTWIFRIAVNACKNKLKSAAFRQKKKTISMGNPGGEPGSGIREVFQNGARLPDEQMEQKERVRRIRKSINTLVLEQKEVITLRDIEGLSYSEISEVTGVSLGTVKSRLARARAELRKRLKSMV
jgi:RNA polymerase sigma-70 factor (ECF subfamily)